MVNDDQEIADGAVKQGDANNRAFLQIQARVNSAGVRSQHIVNFRLYRSIDALKRNRCLRLAVDLRPFVSGLSEPQSQRIVMKEQVRNGNSQRLRIERLRQLQQPRLVVVMRIGKLELEEPRLHWRQRHLARDRLLLRFSPEAVFRNRGELSDRLF